MSRPLRLACCAALVALAAVIPTFVTAQDAAAGIEESNAAFEAAIAAGDVDAVVSLYTDDALLMAPNAPAAEGLEAIRAAFEALLEGVGSLALTTREVEAYGDTASEVGSYVLEGHDGSHLDHGKYLVIWKRTADGWKLHRDIFNSDMAPPGGG